jgi:addiction module HigA family antidote
VLGSNWRIDMGEEVGRRQSVRRVRILGALGRALGVSPRSINEIVLGRRAITPEMTLKLGKFFKQSPQFWFNIQTACDFRRIMKQANRITAKVKGDFTKLAA